MSYTDGVGFVEKLLPPTPVDVESLGDAVLRLNDHFRDLGDPARLRYAKASWDEEPAMFVMLRLALEMPACDGTDGLLCWEPDTRKRYEKLLSDYFSPHRGVLALHRFVTAEQLVEWSDCLGIPVPDPVEADGESVT